MGETTFARKSSIKPVLVGVRSSTMKLLNVRNGDVDLSVQVRGEGPTLLLLHGWPDSGALWDEMVPDFVDRGYRVAAPDLRGCGLSTKPTDTASYKMARLVTDVACIIDALGDEPVTLVGHDWGAALAWSAATYLPERVNHLVALSVGHPSSFYSAGIEQQMRSWYMMLFSQDGLGEAFLRRNDYEAIRRWSGHPHAKIALFKESRAGETRVALTPDAVKSLVGEGWEVVVQRGAGSCRTSTTRPTKRSARRSPTRRRRRQPARQPADARGGRVTARGFDAPLVPLAAARPGHRRRSTTAA
jgi:pimeloyl-ACP methyl ester carboxylesterase